MCSAWARFWGYKLRRQLIATNAVKQQLHGVITRYGRKVVPEDIGQVIGGILIAALAEILRLGKLTLRRAMGSGAAVMIALVSISVSDISLANDGGVYFGSGQSRFVE